MPNRRRLSRDLVLELTCPKDKEAWYADTMVRGFGLRVWPRPDGSIGKAYCVRTKGASGKAVRRTFDYWRDVWPFPATFDYSYPPKPFDISEFEIENQLEYARRWARDTIDRERKALPEYSVELERQKGLQSERLSQTPFRRVAEVTLKNMEITGSTRRYTLRLEKLLFQHLPSALLDAPIAKLDPELVWDEIEKIRLQGANFKSLRMIVRRIFQNFHELSGTRNSYEVSKPWKNVQSENVDPIFEFLMQMKADTLKALIDQFLTMNVFVPQARCIFLFLDNWKTPLIRCQAAKLDEFRVLEPRKKFYNDRLFRPVIWKFGSSEDDFCVLGEPTARLLDLIGNDETWSDVPNKFLFPSQHHNYSTPIRTISSAWNYWLDTNSLPIVSPARFRRVLFERKIQTYWEF